jgi:hypothetical protein
MITFSLFGKHGRLGNQLFQYAAMIGFSKRYNTEMCLPSWPIDCFETEPLIRVSHVPKKKINEPEFHYTPDFFDQFDYNDKNHEMDFLGYFQTEKYFSHCADEVKKAMRFKPWFKSKIREKYKDYFEKEIIAVCVRRGDYVDNPNYALLPITYYLAALEKHFPKHANSWIFVFSDDPDYCELHFKAWHNVVVIRGNTATQDLCLMAQCDHFVIGNSSFHWWGAYLGEKKTSKVIHPNCLFRGTLALKNSDTGDFYPKRWKAFDAFHGDNIITMDLSDVTFTIPIRHDSMDRVKNLELCVYLLQKYFKTNIIIGEQGSQRFGYMGKFCEYVEFKDMKVFHRTKMLNDMAKMAKTPIVANWDADVMVSPLALLESVKLIRKQLHCCYPYDGNFGRVERNWFKVVERHGDIGVYGVTTFKGMNPGSQTSFGGAVLFRRDAFFEGGGENENMISFGPEDYERHERFKKLGYRIGRISGPIYHMAHYIGTDSNPRNPYFKHNWDEYRKIQAMTDKELKAYVNSENWVPQL